MEYRQQRFDQFMRIYKEWVVPPDKLKQIERRSR